MPYRIENNCVQVKKSGKWQNLKCYDNAKDARAYLSALQANVGSEKNMENKDIDPKLLETEYGELKQEKTIGSKSWKAECYSQSEVAYNVVSTNNAQVCANCRWFKSEDMYRPCHIVENEPMPIVSGGWCDVWQQNPKSMGMMPEMEVEIEIEDDDFFDSVHPAMGLVSKVWKTKSIQPVMDYVNNIFHKSQLPDSFGTSGFKSLDDNKWLAWYTNNFKDREDEIFPEHKIARFVKLANDGLLPMPELWYYHIKGTRIGQAIKLFHVGHFVVALGEWDNPTENKLVAPVKRWESKTDTRLSHGFFYDEKQKKNGVYGDFATFEISLLDNGVEANPYTPFNYPIKSNEVNKIMSVSEVQKNAVYAVFDKSIADEIIKAASTGGKALEEAGIAFKKVMPTDKPKKGDGMEDDEEDMSKEGKILLAAISQSHKALDERLTALEGGNQSDNKKADDNIALLQSFDSDIQDIQTAVRSLSERFDKFTRQTPRASKSAQTQLPDDDNHANWIHKKNYEGGNAGQKGILQQMIDYGQVELTKAFPTDDEIPAPPFMQNGNTE